MTALEGIKSRLRSGGSGGEAPGAAPMARDDLPETRPETPVEELNDLEKQPSPVAEQGVATIEAAQALWGKRGRWLIIVGLALIMIIYEIDNSTVYIYKNYATSDFNALSKLATLATAKTILFALIKPPLAKLSNVIGRGQTYLLTISFYILAYLLEASAKDFNSWAAGSVLYTVGQSGTNLMNDIVISDITTARWRGFAIGLSFAPFLVTPWIAAFIVDSVVAPNGIGWRWGIGMLAIMMPFCASFIIITLLYYQRKAKKQGLAPPTRMSLVEFCSQIDLGGIILFSGGIALVLLPLTLAATTPSQWKTPWIIALIAVGMVLVIALPFYETRVAKHPIVPVRYFRNLTIACCLILTAVDSLGFSCTHTYLYAWATVARGFSARDATFFVYVNGVVQCLVAIVAGLLMAKFRRYKWIILAGSIIRLVGYGVMMRLRGSDNSMAEVFIVQVIQGIGSGIVHGCLLVPAQISVTHAEMPQMTALVICFSILGSSVGACVAGGIYTNTLVPALYSYMPQGTSATLINSLANSITGTVPKWGTLERIAVSHAFSDVLKYMTYAALGSSGIGLIIAFFIPNLELPEKNNLVDE